MRMMSSSIPALALGLILISIVGQSYGQLKVGFYVGKCGNNTDVEKIIYDVVAKAWQTDKTLAAAFLRMQFHDCFVRGCDASILLDGPDSEKTAIPNGSVRGYELVDAAKAAVEAKCPGVVSCADIIIIITRVTVYLGGGKLYQVETGRRDGNTSIAMDALTNLPPPNIPIPNAVSAFQAKGLAPEDFVLLLGSGHTVGISHCVNFQDRLYNYNNTGKSDPSISPTFLPVLKKTCPSDGSGSFAYLDQVTPSTVDNGFYNSIKARKGILQVDQDLAFNAATSGYVNKYASNAGTFNYAFGYALTKLGRVGVLTGKQGEIRKSCRSVNSKTY